MRLLLFLVTVLLPTTVNAQMIMNGDPQPQSSNGGYLSFS